MNPKNPNSDNMSTPKLRFKEFKGEWKIFKMSDMINFISGFAFESTKMLSNGGMYQLIKMSNVYKSELQLDRSPSYWDEMDERYKKVLLRKGDVILTLTGTVGKRDYGYSVVIPEDNKYLLNQRLVCLRNKINLSDSGFINGITKTSHFLYHFFNESKGGTGNQSNVGVEDLRNIKVTFPSLPEQQKIASFLSAVDEKIQQLTRKKELLAEYKKGIMQQLFSGKLRFKGENGKPYPKWEVKRLDDLCDVRDGTHDSPKYHSTGKPLLTSKNLKENGTISLDEVNYISDEDFDKINKRSGVSVGDILFGMIGTIGNPAIVKHTGFAIKNVALIKIGSKLSNTFLLQYFKSDLTLRQFHTLNTGNTQKFVSLSTIRGLKVSLPVTEEQQKIASFLSAIDAKIEGVANQITKAQTFKKGLLQQMFV